MLVLKYNEKVKASTKEPVAIIKEETKVDEVPKIEEPKAEAPKPEEPKLELQR